MPASSCCSRRSAHCRKRLCFWWSFSASPFGPRPPTPTSSHFPLHSCPIRIAQSMSDAAKYKPMAPTSPNSDVNKSKETHDEEKRAPIPPSRYENPFKEPPGIGSILNSLPTDRRTLAEARIVVPMTVRIYPFWTLTWCFGTSARAFSLLLLVSLVFFHASLIGISAWQLPHDHYFSTKANCRSGLSWLPSALSPSYSTPHKKLIQCYSVPAELYTIIASVFGLMVTTIWFIRKWTIPHGSTWHVPRTCCKTFLEGFCIPVFLIFLIALSLLGWLTVRQNGFLTYGFSNPSPSTIDNAPSGMGVPDGTPIGRFCALLAAALSTIQTFALWASYLGACGHACCGLRQTFRDPFCTDIGGDLDGHYCKFASCSRSSCC